MKTTPKPNKPVTKTSTSKRTSTIVVKLDEQLKADLDSLSESTMVPLARIVRCAVALIVANPKLLRRV